MSNQPVVFIVDDDPAARDSVAALVASKGVAVDTFASAEEFLAAFDPARQGCLVADVRMTGMSGLDLQEALAARNILLPMIVITGFGDIPTAVRAMRAGAFTFLEKPCRAEELWAAVQRALGTAANREQKSRHAADVQARAAQLSNEETRVLQLMLAGRTNKVMAADLDLGLRTLELRRATIMKKMQAETFAELVRMILSIEHTPEGCNLAGSPRTA